MPWIKKDDRYHLHRKVRPLSDAAYRLEDEALQWSSENGTDGHIPSADLPFVSEVADPVAAAAELVMRGRWHAPRHKCKREHCRPIKDGHLIHDYLDYNPTAEHVAAVRAKRAEAGRVGGSKKPSNVRQLGAANG